MRPTRELFPPEQRRILSRRLLEMAYYLDRTGRPHLARQAQAAGEDLERERSLLERENPFLFGLLMFPLREMYEMEKEHERRRNHITRAGFSLIFKGLHSLAIEPEPLA